MNSFIMTFYFWLIMQTIETTTFRNYLCLDFTMNNSNQHRLLTQFFCSHQIQTPKCQ